jgi:hypothetical protein
MKLFMGKQLFRLVPIAAAALLLSGVPSFADTYTFSPVPLSGDIEGAPGSVIGWGYSITNDSSTDWLETLAVDSNPGPPRMVQKLI